MNSQEGTSQKTPKTKVVLKTEKTKINKGKHITTRPMPPKENKVQLHTTKTTENENQPAEETN